MIVSLTDAKTYLGESSTTYDTFLTQQLQFLSDTVEAYCGRSFVAKTWVQTFYRKDYDYISNGIFLYHYPVSSVAYIKEADTLSGISSAVAINSDDYRIHKPSGKITRNDRCSTLTSSEVIQVRYTAGYANVPTPIRQVILNLIQEQYNRKKAGVALNFGSDVQSIAIPGVISVQFDYTLNANERSNSYGSFLGAYLNALDPYRSERTVIGSGRLEYVDEATP